MSSRSLDSFFAMASRLLRPWKATLFARVGQVAANVVLMTPCECGDLDRSEASLGKTHCEVLCSPGSLGLLPSLASAVRLRRSGKCVSHQKDQAVKPREYLPLRIGSLIRLRPARFPRRPGFRFPCWHAHLMGPWQNRSPKQNTMAEP